MNKVKLLKASPFYESYIKVFYEEHPGLENESYQKQYDTIMADCFAWADFWKKNLEKTGKFEVTEIITTAEPLQKMWAKEHNISYLEKNWKLDILEAQIAKYTPEIFFLHDFLNINAAFTKKIRARFPFLKKIIGWDGIARNDLSIFAGCNLMISCLPPVLDFYKSQGFLTHFFPSSFEASVLQKISPNRPKTDCTFIGSILISGNKHRNRLKLLSYLLKNAGLQIMAASLPSWKEFFIRELKALLKLDFENILKLSEILVLWNIKTHNKKPVFGLDMYQALADSKITVNMHIGKAGNFGGNMRMFEATGTGTCLLTDRKENNKDYFEDGKEIVTYATKEECLDKIKYLLSHEDERQKIAEAGQKRTLRDYNLEKAVCELGEKILML